MTVTAMSPRRPASLLAALTIVFVLVLGARAHATSYLELTPDQMLDKAAIVFVGKVSDTTVKLLSGQPWTQVTFDVETPIEGVPTDANGNAKGPVQLSFLGGNAAIGPSLTVSGMPQFQNGDRVLIFAYHQDYASPIVGYRQGLWRVTAAGLVDEDGRQLSIDDNGNLVAGGSGAALQDVVDAIRTLLGSKAATP